MSLFTEMSLIRAALAADATLDAWCNATFGSSAKVLIGNRDIDLVNASDYPVVIVVAQPRSMFDDLVPYSIGIGIVREDYDTAMQYVAEMADQVITALLASSQFAARVTRMVPDGDMHHPKHHLQLDAEFTDFTEDLSALSDFITFHADSQLDADPEPELTTEEVLPVLTPSRSNPPTA